MLSHPKQKQKQTFRSRRIHWWIFPTFKEEMIPISHKLFQETEREHFLPHLIRTNIMIHLILDKGQEAIGQIMLIIIPDKDTVRKK